MNRFATIALLISSSTTAVAGGDREAVSLSVDRGDSTSDASVEIWPPRVKFPFPKSSTGPYDPTVDYYADLGSDTVEIEYVGSAMGFRGSHEYGFDVDGDEYTVEVSDNGRQSRLSLYDADGELVVGHVTSDRGAYIFDDEGIVATGRPGQIDISPIQEYGLEAALLTNPVFLSTLLEANGETFAGDDDPPGYWWVPAALLIARCAEIGVTYDSDGNWSVSAGWDC